MVHGKRLRHRLGHGFAIKINPITQQTVCIPEVKLLGIVLGLRFGQQKK